MKKEKEIRKNLEELFGLMMTKPPFDKVEIPPITVFPIDKILDLFEKEKAKDRQGFIEVLEGVLQNRILDITDEYKKTYFESGVSIFVGCPADIIKDVKNKLKNS